jgi:hypothetical protein
MIDVRLAEILLEILSLHQRFKELDRKLAETWNLQPEEWELESLANELAEIKGKVDKLRSVPVEGELGLIVQAQTDAFGGAVIGFGNRIWLLGQLGPLLAQWTDRAAESREFLRISEEAIKRIEEVSEDLFEGQQD